MEEFKKVNLNYTMEENITAVLGNNQYTVKMNNIAYIGVWNIFLVGKLSKTNS